MKITVEMNTCNQYTCVCMHMYLYCIYIVFMDAWNFQGAYIPKTAKIIAQAVT